MYKKYLITGVLTLFFVGCTGKDTIPPMPPKDEKAIVEEMRTRGELQSKLERIRNPIVGEDVGEQKKDARKEIDTLLGDAKRYKKKVSRFEKAQLLAYSKAKKSYKYKLKRSGKKIQKKPLEKKETINMVNEYENKLKYY